LLPLPYPLDKRLAAQLGAAGVLGIQLALNDDLRCNAGMVGAGHEYRVAAKHAMVAGQAVHDRVIEGVSHVQGASDVRGRKLDGVRFATFRCVRGCVAAGPEYAHAFPFLVPGAFQLMGFKTFGQFVGGRCLSHSVSSGWACGLWPPGPKVSKMVSLYRKPLF